MRLRELQRLCVDRFSAAAAHPRLEDRINGGSISKSARIAVYENNFAEIVGNTLRNVFPTVEQLVGDACFRSLAITYSQSHASRSGDLQSYGEAFPAVLDQIYSSTKHAYLADVARLEFALDECLTARYQQGISVEELRAAFAIEGGDVRLTPNPSLQVIESRFPILAIWRAHRDNELANLSLDEQAQNIVVIRAGSDAQMTAVSKTGARLITALSEQTSIDEALSQLGDVDTEQLAQALRDTFVSGAFTGIATA